IVKAIREVLSVDDFAEMTLECAPGQLSEQILQSMPSLGFNRVILGVQSFVDQEAAAVGRTHTRAITMHDIDRLRAAGIDDTNIPLIDGQTHPSRLNSPNSHVHAIAK